MATTTATRSTSSGRAGITSLFAATTDAYIAAATQHGLPSSRMSIAGLLRTPLIALLLRNRNYGLYSLGSAFSLTGMWMERIAVGWLTWQLTESGFWLGVVAFADFFPVIVIAPVAGAAADRWDRLRVVKISQFILLAQALVLFAATASGHINVAMIVALTAIHGIVVAFNQPARLALVPSLVPLADLGPAVAVNSVIFNLARFIGPIFAGLAIVWSGVAAAFAANTLSYVVFLVALARIRMVPDDAATATQSHFLAEIRDGIRYTWTHPGIGTLFVLLIAIGIGGRPLTELMPGLADEVYRAGAGGLSILASSVGAGAIVGGMWLAHTANKSNLMAVTLATTLGQAVSAIAIVATDRLWLAVPAVVAYGFCVAAAGVASQTLVQLASDRSMRGRVMALYGLIFRGGPAIGALGAGILSVRLGLRWPVLIGAMLLAVAWLWAYLGRHRIAQALKPPDADGGG
jgi:MFS family permease